MYEGFYRKKDGGLAIRYVACANSADAIRVLRAYENTMGGTLYWATYDGGKRVIFNG